MQRCSLSPLPSFLPPHSRVGAGLPSFVRSSFKLLLLVPRCLLIRRLTVSHWSIVVGRKQWPERSERASERASAEKPSGWQASKPLRTYVIEQGSLLHGVRTAREANVLNGRRLINYSPAFFLLFTWTS